MHTSLTALILCNEATVILSSAHICHIRGKNQLGINARVVEETGLCPAALMLCVVSQSAQQAAALEVQRLEELQQEEARDRQQQLEKARLRGSHALRREQHTQVELCLMHGAVVSS